MPLCVGKGCIKLAWKFVLGHKKQLIWLSAPTHMEAMNIHEAVPALCMIFKRP